MIRRLTGQLGGLDGKPRASGDDPYAGAGDSFTLPVNPARAGMIPRRIGGAP